MGEYFLELKGISKAFPGVQALDNVSLQVRPGSVHALMGENGAGKSTLMKCLFGIYKMDAGQILLEGEEVSVINPLDALQKGIAMVHQELQPIPDRSIAENIFCGRYPTKGVWPIRWTDDKKMNEEAQKWLGEVSLNMDSKTKLRELSISQMQIVEIAKAISMNAKLVILDEPTSSLTQSEVEKLFAIINRLRERGVAIIYISHKMDEILRISDEVTIMRDGQYIGTWKSSEMTVDMIISKMVGRDLTNVYPPKTNTPGEVVFSVRNYSSTLPHSFKEVNFDLRKGEILGFAGLVGAQRTELMEAIFGLRSLEKGSVELNKRVLRIKRPRDAILSKIGMITEDRRGSGIFGVLSVKDNISVSSLNNYLLAGIVLDDAKIDKLVNDNVGRLSIKTPDLRTLIKSLSGGNQQKVIISRWLANNPDVLIMDEPTRGIDVGAKYEIYQIMINLANEGKSIIMVSSEMAELIGVADRIAVMCNGRLTGIVEGEEANQERIMQLATQF
ncbi:MAG: sugar ABC transporter ATP-binding protein [Oscillospiraceae bacterium]|nr:sugar ABC transporter ATP-binding protein [Oscillospiraceae bacterium]